MDPFSIVGGLTAAAVTGLGIGASVRLLPEAWRVSRDVRAWSKSPNGLVERARQDELQRRQKKLKLQGRTRESSIVGLYQDLLRHVDGSYTGGYELPLQASMLGPDEIADAVIDGFADMLTVELPAGTVFQFRYAVAPDPGRALAEHLRARDYKSTHFPSSRLHDRNIDFFKAMADAGAFRHERASLFVRVPGRHTEDRSLYGFNAFIASMANDWREHGPRNIREIIGSNWSKTRNDGVVRRIREHEEESLRKSEKTFRLLELQSPVSLRR